MLEHPGEAFYGFTGSEVYVSQECCEKRSSVFWTLPDDIDTLRGEYGHRKYVGQHRSGGWSLAVNQHSLGGVACATGQG